MSTTRLPAALLAVCLPAALVACAPAPTPGLPAAATPPPTMAGPSTVVTPVAVTDAATLEDQLRALGVQLTYESEQNLGYLEPLGRIYRLAGTDSLEVHTYPDAAAAAAAAGRVAPDGRMIRDATGEAIAIQWLGTPHFFRSGPLLVIYVGTNADTLQALAATLGPQFAGG